MLRISSHLKEHLTPSVGTTSLFESLLCQLLAMGTRVILPSPRPREPYVGTGTAWREWL